MNYKYKYIKYKEKYLFLKNLNKIGGSNIPQPPRYVPVISDAVYINPDTLFTRFYNNNWINILLQKITLTELNDRIVSLIDFINRNKTEESDEFNLNSSNYFIKMIEFLQNIATNKDLVNIFKQFYYYEIFRMYKRIEAAKDKIETDITEVYLILQNSLDDNTVFAQTSIIYDQLIGIASKTNTEVHIYHTLNEDENMRLTIAASSLDVRLIINDSLSNYSNYLQILQDLNTTNKKISFLYLSSHGDYINIHKEEASLVGKFNGIESDPINLPRVNLKTLFENIKPILTKDCNVVLNSCFLGQTDLPQEPIIRIRYDGHKEKIFMTSTAEYISKIIPMNIVIAARGAIKSGSLEQKFYYDEMTRRIIFTGNFINNSKNRLYAYCQNITLTIYTSYVYNIFRGYNPAFPRPYLEKFTPDSLRSNDINSITIS